MIALEALRRIVLKTPVDTGRARSNWQLSIGRLPTEAVEGVFSPTRYAQTLSDAATKLQTLPPFDIVYIANNLPYIQVLEHGSFRPPDPGPSKDPRPSRKGRVLVTGGFSVQAPRGMVRVTFEELLGLFPDHLRAA